MSSKKRIPSMHFFVAMVAIIEACRLSRINVEDFLVQTTRVYCGDDVADALLRRIAHKKHHGRPLEPDAMAKKVLGAGGYEWNEDTLTWERREDRGDDQEVPAG